MFYLSHGADPPRQFHVPDVRPQKMGHFLAAVDKQHK